MYFCNDFNTSLPLGYSLERVVEQCTAVSLWFYVYSSSTIIKQHTLLKVVNMQRTSILHSGQQQQQRLKRVDCFYMFFMLSGKVRVEGERGGLQSSTAAVYVPGGTSEGRKDVLAVPKLLLLYTV